MSARTQLGALLFAASALNVVIAEGFSPSGAVAGIVDSLAWTAAPFLIAGGLAYGCLRLLTKDRSRAARSIGGAALVTGLLQPFGAGAAYTAAVLTASAAVGVVAWLALAGEGRAEREAKAPTMNPAWIQDAVLAALFLAIAGAAWLLDASAPRSLPPMGQALPGAPPIVLIVVDTLRADLLDARRQDGEPLMPSVRELAADGDRYLQARSASPWTKPSMASIQTGLPVPVHGTSELHAALPASVPTIAERLRSEAGYRTAAIVQNGFLSSRYGFDRGFEHWDQFPSLPAQGRSVGRELQMRMRPRRYLSNAEITDRALQYLTDQTAGPFFLWVHYFDPHLPYEPPPEALALVSSEEGIASFSDLAGVRAGRRVAASERLRIRQLYEAEALAVDGEIGRLLAELDARGLYDRALVALTSDHGEEFWEHRGFEHGHSVYDEVIRVPLVVKNPGSFSPAEVATPVSNMRLAANVLAAAGLDPDWPLEPLSPEAAAEAMTLSTGLLYFEDQLGVVAGTTKLVIDLGGMLPPRRFDLLSDPGEYFPLGAATPEGQRIETLLTQELERYEALRERLGISEQSVEISDELRRELRALGYVR